MCPHGHGPNRKRCTRRNVAPATLSRTGFQIKFHVRTVFKRSLTFQHDPENIQRCWHCPKKNSVTKSRSEHVSLTIWRHHEIPCWTHRRSKIQCYLSGQLVTTETCVEPIRSGILAVGESVIALVECILQMREADLAIWFSFSTSKFNVVDL